MSESSYLQKWTLRYVNLLYSHPSTSTAALKTKIPKSRSKSAAWWPLEGAELSWSSFKLHAPKILIMWILWWFLGRPHSQVCYLIWLRIYLMQIAFTKEVFQKQSEEILEKLPEMMNNNTNNRITKCLKGKARELVYKELLKALTYFRKSRSHRRVYTLQISGEGIKG